MQKNQVLNLNLIPLNENQSINYVEVFHGTFKQLTARLIAIINGLQTTLPHGTFTINLQDIESGEDWYFIRGKFYDTDYYPIVESFPVILESLKQLQNAQLN